MIDLNNAQDLFDDDALFEEIKREGNILIDTKKEKIEGKKERTKSQKELKQLEDANFAKEYQKAGGIQHIICSATMTIDKQGRITPRIAKAEKKQKLRAKTQTGYKKEKEEDLNTVDQLCKVLKFRSKNPKVIDLTSEVRMPATLQEKAIRCAVEEKDLYLYYYLQRKSGQSFIIFTNSITCAKRVASILDFLKVKNYVLHSKMQQKQRLKSLDRFKAAV